MKAMLLKKVGESLAIGDIPVPVPRESQVLIKVSACAVCRTDLHVVDGELPDPKLPLVPGHEIVGTIEETGVKVGVPWLGYTCGRCRYCEEGKENLCDNAGFTGYTIDGGYAEYCVADSRYCFPIPDDYSDIQAAPLLCAGLIGYRSFKMAGDARRLGFFGFGAAAHILIQIARHLGRQVYAFTRPGDEVSQEFARKLGAVWAGDSTESPPEPLDAAIIFAPVGALLPLTLKAVKKGGTVVCAGIYMSDIPPLPYRDLWEERVIRSVSNLTRKDGEEFMALAPEVPVRTEVQTYPLEQANQALDDLRYGRLQGAAVLVP
jgi:propanol-preferring alcohol dehydrogenase